MENNIENNSKVCRRCGTLNDDRSLMCVRCGNGLDITEEQKYSAFKENLTSGIKIVLLFLVLFAAYSYGMIFYAAPWIESKIMLLGETFIFEFYNNATLTYITLETIYTVCLFCINSIVTTLLLDIAIGNKLLKRNNVASTNLYIWLVSLLCIAGMTIYKRGLDYVIIIEHLVSIIVVFPYINKKLFKRSV